jgi:cation transport ATPase
MNAPLQVPALQVPDRGCAEAEVNQLAHVLELTLGRGPALPDRAHSDRAHNEVVIDKAELRRLSPAERQELARTLAELDQGDPEHLADPFLSDPVLRRERRLALIVSAACCVVLAGWSVWLAATLPHHFNAHHWRTVWVNFDVLLLAAFAATAWAIWRERQVLILLLMLLGTMLACDAWFDVGTSLGTSGMWMSIVSALLAELPLAFLAFAGARRLLKATVIAAAAVGADCSLRQVPLAGSGLDEALPRRVRAE